MHYSVISLFIFFIILPAHAKDHYLVKNSSFESSFLDVREDSIGVESLLESAKEQMSGDIREVIVLINKAYQIAIQLNNVKLQLKAKNQLADAYFSKGDYRNVALLAGEILKLATSLNDLEWIARGHRKMGAVRLVMEDTEQAEKHLIRSKGYFVEFYGDEESFPTELKLHFFNNLGLIYSNLGKYDDAEKQFKGGIELAQIESGYDFNLLQLLNNLGDLLLKTKRYEEAKFQYENAMIRLQSYKHYLLESLISLSIGKLYMELKEPTMALTYFLKGYELAQSGSGNSHLRHLSESISNAYTSLGKPDSAFFYLKLSQVYLDSLSLAKSVEKITEEELYFEFGEEKSQLQSLYAKNKTYAFLILGLAFIVTIILLFRNFLIHNRLEVISEEKMVLGEVIEKANEENRALQDHLQLNEKGRAIEAINNIQQEKILEELKITLDTDEGKRINPAMKERVAKLIDGLNPNKGVSALTEFEYRFSKVHADFFEKLTREFPQLSLSERRLAAFLKLQLTTKEIIAITGQSVRAVELGRIRIRKKLNLTNSKTSLYDFFVNY